MNTNTVAHDLLEALTSGEDTIEGDTVEKVVDHLAEDLIYYAQEKWIEDNYPHRQANIGWAVDRVEGTISTKIYGVGVLTTSLWPLKHSFSQYG